MQIAATGDIHAPKNLDLLRKALKGIGSPDVLLLAGDSVLRNDYAKMPTVASTIREVCSGPIVACFGNEEYDQGREEYEKVSGITWLYDEATILNIGGVSLGIVGSRGSLDRPTFWQRVNVKGIWETYRYRVSVIDSLLMDMAADVKVVMTHYAPTYRTLVGERERVWPEMGSRRFEEVIEGRQPDLWVHAHAHKGKIFEATIGRTLVVNVSLPARGEIVILEVPR